MNKEFIPYDEALALKELGFNEKCFNRFYTKPNSKMFGIDEHGRSYLIKNVSKKLYTIGEHVTLNETNAILSPLYQQAFRWFREKHDIVGDVTIFDRGFLEKDKWCYQFRIHLPNDPNNYLIDIHEFKTYEEAELACLRELIELVKLKE